MEDAKDSMVKSSENSEAGSTEVAAELSIVSLSSSSALRCPFWVSSMGLSTLVSRDFVRPRAWLTDLGVKSFAWSQKSTELDNIKLSRYILATIRVHL